MSEYIATPCRTIKEGESLDIKVPKSNVKIGVSVMFKEDGVYEVVVAKNQSLIEVTKAKN